MHPPRPVRRSFALWIAAVVVGLLGSVVSLTVAPPRADVPGEVTGGVVGGVIGLLFLALLVFCAFRLRRGENWARLTLTVLGGLSVLSTVVGLLLSAGLGIGFGAVSTVANLLQAALTAAAVLSAYQAPANAWFR